MLPKEEEGDVQKTLHVGRDPAAAREEFKFSCSSLLLCSLCSLRLPPPLFPHHFITSSLFSLHY
jgi:hypothetical protein